MRAPTVRWWLPTSYTPANGRPESSRGASVSSISSSSDSTPGRSLRSTVRRRGSSPPNAGSVRSSDRSSICARGTSGWSTRSSSSTRPMQSSRVRQPSPASSRRTSSAIQVKYATTCSGVPPHTRLRYQLHADTRARVDLLEIVDELRQVLDRVDVVVRRRRDQGHARYRVAQARDQGRDLVGRELASFTGLRALGDLDLELIRAHQIVRRDAEPP